jgi:hypothetical protein
MSTSVYTGLNPFNFITLSAQRLSERTVVYLRCPNFIAIRFGDFLVC